MKSWIAKALPPLRTLIIERNERQEEGKSNHCQRDPGILNPNQVCKRNGIKSNGETVHLPPEIDQRAEFGGLRFVALRSTEG